MALLNAPPVDSQPQRRVVGTGVAIDQILSLSATTLLLVLSTVVGAVLRLRDLGSQSLWYDESISINIAARPLGEILRARLRINASDNLIDHLYTNNPPIHLVLLHAINTVTTNDAAYRLPFAIAGIATIPVTFALVRRLFGAATGLCCAALVAVSPLHIAYSQEARPTSFLVLLAILSLLYLLDAAQTDQPGAWAKFTIVTILGVWTSYFALVLVTPTLFVIWLILARPRLTGTSRHRFRQTVRRPTIAFVIVGISSTPLLPDLLATSSMNDASVTGGPSPIFALVGVVVAILMANPISINDAATLVTFVLFIVGIYAMARHRSQAAVVAITWIAAPLIILGVIQSSHRLELRYFLFVLPMVLIMVIFGLEVIVARLVHGRHRSGRWLHVAVSIPLLLASVVGLLTVPPERVSGAPVKPDWRSAIHQFLDSATTESCLIVADGEVHAMSGIVQHYMSNAEVERCSIDIRDPRLLEKISSHQDLWWAIGMNRYPSDRMPALEQAFSAQIDVFAYDQVLLIHPALTINASDRIAMVEGFLARAIQATEPFEGKKSSYYAPLRMGLANVILLKCGSNAPAQSIVDLLGPYTVEASVDDVVSGVRAQERIVQGDIAGARALAVRLIGLVPGNANMYGYMAVVEAAGGHATAAGYRAAEAALRSGLTPATTYDFPSCYSQLAAQ